MLIKLQASQSYARQACQGDETAGKGSGDEEAYEAFDDG
jgi:hypothetical protein